MSAASSNDSYHHKDSPEPSPRSSDGEKHDHEEEEEEDEDLDGAKARAAVFAAAEANRRAMVKGNPDMEKIFNDLDSEKMWDECGIRKPRGGYRVLYDWQKTKLYEWQLARDEKLLREHNSPMQERNYNYIAYRRQQSELFNEIEKPAYRTANGNFEKIAAECAEVSWRATSRPMGHARLSRILPVYTGIPEAEVKERLRSGKPFSDQEIRERKRKYERDKLWDDLKSGRIPVDDDEPVHEEEEVKVNSDEEEEDAAEMEKQRQANVAKANAKTDAGSADGSDPSSSNDASPAKMEVVTRDSKMGERVRKRRAIASGNFASLRYYTTLKERTESLHNWNHGNCADFDYSGGFPEVTGLDDAPRKENIRLSEAEKYAKFLAGQISSKFYIKKKDQMETLYVRFREKHMIIRAKKLVEDRREAEREAAAKRELQRERRAIEDARIAAAAAKAGTRTGAGARAGAVTSGKGGSSLKDNIFQSSAMMLARKNALVPALPGVGQGSVKDKTNDVMSTKEQGQGLAPGVEQSMWEGPPGHAAATAKAEGKTRMEKERDETMKKTIAKKLPHNIGQSRSPPLLPPVTPALEGGGISSINKNEGKKEEDMFPYPPANTPMMGRTPDQTARSRQSDTEGGWWPTYDTTTGTWGSITVPTLMSPGADADDEASPNKSKKGPAPKPLSRAARRRAKTREIKVMALSPTKPSAKLGSSDDGNSSNGGFSNSVSNSVADFSVGSWNAASVGSGGVMTRGGIGPLSPPIIDTYKSGTQLIRSLEKLEILDEKEREREKNGGLFSPEGSVSDMDDSLGDDSSLASLKKKKKKAKKLEKAAARKAAEGTNALSINTGRWYGGDADDASAMSSPSFSNFPSPYRGQGMFTPSSMSPLALSPSSFSLKLAAKLTSTMELLKSPLSRKGREEVQIAIQVAAEVTAKRAAQASKVAAQAAMELARDQFRHKLKILTTAIMATDTGHDLAAGYQQYLKQQNKSIHTFEEQFEKLTGVKIKLLGDGSSKKKALNVEQEAFGDAVGALLEQQQMEELEKALLDEKAALDERTFVENLYKTRARETYRANFVYNQLDQVIYIEGGEANQIYAAEDLIRASRRGDWRKVIDIMEHPYYPVSPNTMDPVTRQTATFATLISILTRSGGDALLDALDQTPVKRLFTYLKSFVYKEQNRMDWVVKILLDQGGDVNFIWEERGEDGVSLLHKAAELGNFNYLKWLFKRGAVGRTRTSRDGITPLMLACKHNYIDMVLYLLEFGDSMAILDWSDEFGNTALHYACQGGSPLLVEVLLTCGIKMPHRNHNGEMAIDVARIRLADDIVNVMQKYTNKVKDIEIRMHFNSLIFPKEGVLNMGALDDAFKDLEVPVEEEGEGEEGTIEGGGEEQSMVSVDGSSLLDGGQLYPLTEDVQEGELSDG